MTDVGTAGCSLPEWTMEVGSRRLPRGLAAPPCDPATFWTRRAGVHGDRAARVEETRYGFGRGLAGEGNGGLERHCCRRWEGVACLRWVPGGQGMGLRGENGMSNWGIRV